MIKRTFGVLLNQLRKMNFSSNTTFSINYDLAMTFTFLSIAVFIFVGISLCVMHCVTLPNDHHPRLEVGVLAFAVLVSLLQMVSYKSSGDDRELKEINKISRIIMEIFGTIVFIVGSSQFFRRRENDDVMLPLNKQHKNVASFVLGMTAVLGIYSAILIIGAFLGHKPLKSLIIGGLITSLIQKLTQAFIYYCSLQHKVPVNDKLVGATWFFKLLSLFNFLMFLNDLINLSKENDDNFKTFSTNISNLLSVTYDSFDVEYRLLMAFLFFEHSLSIDSYVWNQRFGGNVLEENDEDIYEDMDQVKRTETIMNDYLSISQAKGLGLLAGFILFLMQFANILEYRSQNFGWSNSFGIFVDVCLVTGGILFLLMLKKNLPQGYVLPVSNSVELLTIMMGVVSILYWIFRCVLVLAWSADINHYNYEYSYLLWNAAKYGSRSVSTFIQILVYGCVSHNISHYDAIIHNRAINALLLFQVCSFASVYVNSVIENYSGIIEKSIQGSDLAVSFVILYQAGGPIHLGFAFHVFLHFLNISRNFVFRRGGRAEENKDPHRRRNSQNAPLLNDANRRH